MRTGLNVKRRARRLRPGGRVPRGLRAEPSRTRPARSPSHGTRHGSRRRSAENPDERATRRGSGTYEALDPAFEAQAGRFALEQRIERAAVAHALVDLHAGRWVVAPMHPSSFYAGLSFDRAEKLLDRSPHFGEPCEVHAVVDVVVRHAA